MRSHAYVHRIEDGIVVLELRLTPIDYVPPSMEETKRRFKYPRKMVPIPVGDVTNVIHDVKERDVIVVEHTEGTIQGICYLDETETQLRQKRAEARRESLRAKIKKSDKCQI